MSNKLTLTTISAEAEDRLAETLATNFFARAIQKANRKVRELTREIDDAFSRELTAPSDVTKSYVKAYYDGRPTPEITRWTLLRTNKRPAQWILRATGCKDKAELLRKYPIRATFQWGKPLPTPRAVPLKA